MGQNGRPKVVDRPKKTTGILTPGTAWSYRPAVDRATKPALMRQIEEQYLRTPFCRSRDIFRAAECRPQVRRRGVRIGHAAVAQPSLVGFYLTDCIELFSATGCQVVRRWSLRQMEAA